MASGSANARPIAMAAPAGPAIVWAGRDATCRRTSAVALTTFATLALSAIGACAVRTPAVPLSADRRADRSRIRFKRSYFDGDDARHIGPPAAKV